MENNNQLIQFANQTGIVSLLLNHLLLDNKNNRAVIDALITLSSGSSEPFELHHLSQLGDLLVNPNNELNLRDKTRRSSGKIASKKLNKLLLDIKSLKQNPEDEEERFVLYYKGGTKNQHNKVTKSIFTFYLMDHIKDLFHLIDKKDSLRNIKKIVKAYVHNRYPHLKVKQVDMNNKKKNAATKSRTW